MEINKEGGAPVKICMVAEGCYPYVVGGVSSWVHSLIQSFPEHEFIVLTIVSDRSQRGKFSYELPENVSAVYETYLDDYDWSGSDKRHRKSKHRLKKKEYAALQSLLLDHRVQWDVLFDLFSDPKLSVDELLMGEDFFYIAKECYAQQYSHVIFSDFLWTMRSIYLPMFLVLKMNVPQADLYHCVATGYAGLLGAMATHRYGCKLLISEHGIYTREREEELIKATWVKNEYKNLWIAQFRKMSRVAYDRADLVTSLYEHARGLQMELGCPEEKTVVTPNGINIKRFENLPGKLPEDEGMVNIGAVLRVTPIKDVKTMIQAFAFAKQRVPNLKLWVMGPYEEDPDYAQECFDLVDAQHIRDVVFTGRINVSDYLGRMDFTILTSISEGQPLTILESYAAHLPVIATDVGNCRELIYGPNDDFGTAGILTHIMNLEEVANAMVELALSPKMREQMGESGYRRVNNGYSIDDMKQKYREIYDGFERGEDAWQESALS
jgi:glycosyltransferase involved in cell wall biosynthesis